MSKIHSVSGPVVLICASLLVGCSQGNGSGGGSASSSSSSTASKNLTLKFTSSTLKSTSRLDSLALATGTGINCSVTVDGSGKVGTCYTPIRISGFFNKASLGSTNGGLPVRILGGGSSTTGLANVFLKETFDLKSALSMTTEDNIEDGTASSYNFVSIDTPMIEYVFEATTGGTSKFYTVRNYFADSIPSKSTTYTACGLSAGELQEADTYGTLTADVNAKRGDIMVCPKSTATATCAASDFLWVDSTGTATNTRPTTPLTLSGPKLTNSASCSTLSGRPEITPNYAEFSFGLATAVSVTAANNSGTKTYTVSGKSGTKLTATVDVKTTSSLFVPSTATEVAELGSIASEATLYKNLNKILLTPIYWINNKTTDGSGDGSAMTSTVTLSVD